MIARRKTRLAASVFMLTGMAVGTAQSQCERVLLAEFGGRRQAQQYGDIDFAGDVMLVAIGPAGVESIDVSDTLHPRTRGRLEMEGVSIACLTADGNLAVASSDSRLILLETSDPAGPEVLDIVTLSSEVRGLVLDGACLYVAAGLGGLRTFTVTDSMLEPAGELATANGAIGLAVEGSVCYLLTESAGMVIDVSDINQPAVLADNAPAGRVVDIDAGRAFVGDAGITIVSLAEPSTPTVVTSLTGALAPDQCISLDARGDVLAAMFQVSGGQPCCDECSSYLYDLRVHTLDVTDLSSVALIAGETYGNRRGGSIRLHNGWVCFNADEAGVAFAPAEAPWRISSAVAAPLNDTEFLRFTADPLVPIEAGVMCLQQFLPEWSLQRSNFALVTTDLSSPGRPIVTSTGVLELWGLGWYGLDAVESGIAYITGAEAVNWGWHDCADPDLWGVLQTVDVSDPAHPVPLDRWRTPGADVGQTLAAAVLDGAIVYARAFTSNDVGTYVLDVSEPHDIQTLTAYPTAFGWVASAEQGLLIVDREDSLVLVDGSDIAEPVDIAPIPVHGLTRLVGNRLYVFGDDFSVVDISQPDQPSVLGSLSIEPAGASNHFAVEGTLAACGRRISGDSQRVFIVDFSDPGDPQLVLQYDTSLNAVFTWVQGSLVEGPFNDEPMRVYDVSAPISIALLANAAADDTAFGVTSCDGLAYVSDYAAGLSIYDVTEPGVPLKISTFDTSDSVYEAVVVQDDSGTLAFVANGAAGLLVLDVSDPGAPAAVASLPTVDLALALAVKDGLAFVACRFGGLQIINVSDPASPHLVGGVDTPGSAQNVTLDGNLAYVADGTSGVQVVDITNPASPVIIGSYNTPSSARQVLIRGSVAYVPDRGTGLIALDVSNPAEPRHLATLGGLGDARGVAAPGHHAYVADFFGAVHMVDIADPARMQLLQSRATLGTPRAVSTDAGLLYLADGDAGLTIFEARPCWYRPCPPDLNNDRSLDFFDVQIFLNAWSDAEGLSDWNDDGHINFFDVQRYLIDFSEGCEF